MARNKNSVPSQAHPVKQESDSPEENSSSGEEEEIEIEEEVEEEVEVEEDEEEEEGGGGGHGKSSPSEEEESEEEEEEEEEEASSSEEEEEEDEASKLESIKSLLKPFTKDQLITILKEASSQNPSLLSGLIKTAEADPIHRKIFVHGLGWDVTNEILTAAFKQYGQIEECNVVLDKATGRCKGYGFVLFKTRIGAKKALKEPQKRIGKANRVASCQLAAAGSSGSNSNAGNAGSAIDPTSRKMYIANVGPQVSVEKLRAFFAKFGEIESGPTGMDKVTGKFRGFAIIVFKTVEGMKKALQEPVKEFEGCKLQCSVFIEKNSKQNNANANVGGSSGGVGNVGMQSMPFGLNQGLVGQGFNPGAVFLGQNPGITVLNPLLGIGTGSGLNPAALYPGSVSTSLTRNAASPAGLSGGVQQDISSMSPGLANNYGSQPSLQGMGAYYGAQLGQSSASGGGGSGKGQSGGVGSGGSASTYYGR